MTAENSFKWAQAWRKAADNLASYHPGPASSGWVRYAMARAKIATMRGHLLCATDAAKQL
jgi:hypothetical protein